MNCENVRKEFIIHLKFLHVSIQAIHYFCNKIPKMGLIEIEDMEFYAHHGCYPEERAIGTRFLVNLSIETSLELPAKTDKISDTLNYQEAYLLVKVQMKTTSHLLEHVAARILDALYGKFTGIEKATVKISKMNPPMGGNIEKVSVTLTR